MVTERELPRSPAPTPFSPRNILILALVSVVQLMVIIDASIINVALPSIKTSLHFSESDLQWVVTAYTLIYAGFMLLGGRAADLLGRRAVLMAGMVLFTAASAVAGLSQSSSVLLVARGVQGLGGAIMSPAALSLLLVTFREGTARNRALAIWGMVAGGGGAVGVVLGGVLTQGPGWRWVFFINLPIGLLALLAAPRILAESRGEGGSRSYDVPGAVTVTAALLLLVYAVTQVPTYGWGATRTIAELIGAAALLVVFLLVEGRFASNPLVPLRIFRSPTVAGADAVMALLGLALFSVFFFVSLYMQQILHFSPSRAGLAYLPISAGVVVVAGVGTVLMSRIGARWLVALGMLFVAGGILLLTRIPVHGSFLTDLLPAFILISIGAGLSFPVVTSAGVSGVDRADSGIASGLVNTFQQVGGALGLGLLSTIATTRTNDVLHAQPQTGLPHAIVEGFHRAFLVGGGLAVVGAMVAILAISRSVGKVDAPPATEDEEPTTARPDTVEPLAS
jgi:EmrB/QacA subfamily drug resistance transporter